MINVQSMSDLVCSFRWFKDGQELKEGVKCKILFEDPDVCALVIRNIKIDDAGSYTCKAFNKFGEAFDSAKVSFLCKSLLFKSYFLNFFFYTSIALNSKCCINENE